MGNGTYYGLTDSEFYMVDGTVVTDSKGLSGKVVTAIDDTEYHSSLPSWSKRSKIYFKRDDKGQHEIEQMRVFNDKRRPEVDFDWNHEHKTFKKGTVHVHEWYFDEKKGKCMRGEEPRYMKASEIKEYGELLKKANPNIKLIP